MIFLVSFCGRAWEPLLSAKSDGAMDADAGMFYYDISNV
jgi:hypothetical protein